MDTFDIVIVIIGAVLIIIGLFLFVSGKRDSESANNVEGFGIKLNVSNPSIILIVFGIGLVLFPRLMPTTSPLSNDPQGQSINTPTPVLEQPSVVSQPPTQSAPEAFFPQGVWYLNSYEENGIDLSDVIEGNIRFGQANRSSQQWVADMVAIDGWGNVMNYQYSGVIDFTGSQGYRINTTASNDPTFTLQGPTPLTMKMDSGQILHMEYIFNSSAIMLHWRQ